MGSFEITPVETSGNSPGWIHGHAALLSPDGRSVWIEGGELGRGNPDRSLIENIDVWALDLGAWVWTRLTERKWPRFEVRRQDGNRNHFWEMQMAAWSRDTPSLREALAPPADDIPWPTLEEQLGGPPDLDRYACRYQPPVPHEAVPANEEEYKVHRIRVEGVVVRYVEDMSQVQMTVEGELPAEVIERLAHHLVETMAALERSPFEAVRL